ATGEWTIEGIRRVLYRLPELRGRKTIYIVEGPKDANRLWDLQLPATTNACGAGHWCEEYTAQLKAAGCERVAEFPDNDPPGETHGRQVARSCCDAGLRVKLIPLPGLPPKGDVSTFLEQHTKAEFLAVLDRQRLERDALRQTGQMVPWVFWRMRGTRGSRTGRRATHRPTPIRDFGEDLARSVSRRRLSGTDSP
ncbi:MAG TPA: hypothetical protein VIX63_10375, partial [Vicinamibacterales bacterium]